MASLADATPPIALGALDGRYRGAVAPLVDHLSEAALNRQRVHVEVEWLIHLTSHGVVPGVRALTDDEIAALRAVVDDFGADEVAELGDDRAGHRARRQGRRVLPQEAPDRDRARPSEDQGLAELIHFGCTSEDINNLSYALMVKGAVEQVWLPRAQALVAAGRGRWRASSRTCRCSPTPTASRRRRRRWARSSPSSRTASAASCGASRRQEYLGKFNGATGTFGAHALAAARRRLARGVARLRRGPRPRRGTRSRRRSRATTGRPSSTPTSRASTASCTTSAPTCGPTSRWATSRRCAARAPSGRARCRTRSTRSASRTPRPTSR